MDISEIRFGDYNSNKIKNVNGTNDDEIYWFPIIV